MAPSTRIILALLGVTCAGLLLCAATIYSSLDRLSLRTAEANTDFLLSQLRDTVEANVDLGLSLSDIRLVQDLIERAAATDRQILAVEVFSPAGVSLFNTDRGSIGEVISGTWQETLRYRIENDRWRVDELGNLVFGQVIRNDFAEPVGHVAITLSGQGRGELGQTVLAGLAQQAAMLAPIVLLLVLLVGIVIINLADRDLRRLSADLAAFALPGSSRGSVSAGKCEPVLQAIRQATDDFDAAAAEISQIDENEERDVA